MAKDNLIKLVQTLLESPEDEVVFCVNNKFKLPNEVLGAKRNSPKKQLHFKPHSFVRYLKGVLNFPADYIPITKNVPFDRLVVEKDIDDDFDANEMEQREIEVFTSRIHGKGLRILEDVLQKDVFIMNFLGEIVSSKTLDRRGHKNYAFSFTPKDTSLDAYNFGNEARFLNHSCEPNCYSQIYYKDGFANLGIFSGKAILREEELTIKYLEGIECDCPRCKREAENDDDEDKENLESKKNLETKKRRKKGHKSKKK